MTSADGSKQDGAMEHARRNRPEAISRAGELGAQAFARAGFRDPALVLRWSEIVGPEVARFAQPLKLSEGPTGGTLTLQAEPAASVFLQHQSRSLCERINAYLGRPAVSRLRFVAGAVAEQRPLGRPRLRRSEPSPADPVHGFAGPDRLREALVNLARTRERPARD